MWLWLAAIASIFLYTPIWLFKKWPRDVNSRRFLLSVLPHIHTLLAVFTHVRADTQFPTLV